MRILTAVILACVVYGGYQWWQGRDSGVDAAIASENGFIPVEMPDGVGRNAVLVLAPRNCPSDQAQRTEALVSSLASAGIPVVRGDSFFFDVENPDAAQRAAIKRTVEVFKRGAPAVYMNGMGMSNPTPGQAIAEYRASRSRSI